MDYYEQHQKEVAEMRKLYNETQPTCPIAAAVADQVRQRADVGLRKYGTDMTRKDLSRVDILRHAQQEALDLAVYLEREIQDEQARSNPA